MLENQTGRMVDHRDTGNRMGPAMQMTQDVGRKMGNSGLCLKVLSFVLLSNISCSQAYLYREPLFIDVEAIFGDLLCIEGTLNVIQTDGPVIVSTVDAPIRSPATDVRNEDPTTTDEFKHGAMDLNNTEMANAKEKTPMCLVNELARFNKIQHQYRLTSEQGPAHQKRFTVTLKLGEEDYSAEGASIKKAQHMAASNALKATSYRHPPLKTFKNLRLGKSNITPTVELNALAMKRGEPTVYTFVELPPFPPAPNTYNYQRGMYTQVRPPYQPNFTYDYARRNMTVKPTNPHMYQQQRYYGTKPPMYKVNVKVGGREFCGEGHTAQAARHDAASKALEQIRNLPLEEDNTDINSSCTVDMIATIEADSSSELKSPISLVHELALKRNLNVNFDVMSEKGPPHMKTFITRCTVGDKFESIGEGNGKKISKKRAAEKMLEKLRTLPPTTTVTAAGCTGSMPRMKRKTNPAKKKSRNLIKVINPNNQESNKPDEMETPDELNPISRLIQIQQAKKEKEPVYTLMEERGQPRRREFSMEVTVGEHSFIGTGPNKKIAKRNAAEGLLQIMGYSTSSTVKQRLSSVEINRKAYADNDIVKPSVGGSGGRQLVPGILLMTDPVTVNTGKSNGHSNYHSKHNVRMPMPGAGHSVNIQTTATIAKEYLNGGNSPTAEALGSHTEGKSSPAVRPKDQLLYLAQLLGFRVQFSDFPKGNHSEFLSLVSLSTDPPQVCHGAGSTTDLSHDQAALGALRSLSEMGLDNVTPLKKESPNIGPGNDGLYLNKGGNLMKTNFVNGAPK